MKFYVLRDSKGLYLIDCGFIGGRQLLQRALKKRGWDSCPIIGIIVTHGHLDHILNVGRLAQETGAWIAAPRLDESHYSGCPKYNGLARITGYSRLLDAHYLDLESLPRLVFLIMGIS